MKEQHPLEVLALIAGITAMGLLAVILIAAWSTVTLFAPFVIWLAFVCGALYLVGMSGSHIVIRWLAVFEKRQAMRHAEGRYQLEQHIALTRMAADEQGNYPVYMPPAPVQIAPMLFAPGNSLHGAPRLAAREGQPAIAAPSELASPDIKQPSMRSLLSHLEENALQVCAGVRADTGEPVILSIPDAVHFKLIGSSGFGKSCLAAALLEQAIRTNTPDVLRIALLDLEHKTSKLFEDAPHVLELTQGRRHIPLVATSADEVALQLGLLKLELDRRARLSETALQDEPLLLIYVEEMLSLQYEVAPELLAKMLADLAILAVRARKYRMFLLACSQTDYSTPELRTAQKQFRSRMAFAIDTTAARAAGFMSTELIKWSFTHSAKGSGLYVLETPGLAALMLAPVYDVRQKVLAHERSTARSTGVQDVFTPETMRIVNSERTPVEQPLNTLRTGREQATEANGTHSEQVQQLQALGWGKIAIMEKVWNVKRGGSLKWQQAEQEYNEIVANQAAEQEA